MFDNKLEVPRKFRHNISMKKIEKVFVKANFRHELVKRKKDVAVYKRSQLGYNHHHYEVVKISKHNGYNMGGAYIEAAETYPGNSLWGIQGWTCTTLEQAEKHFQKLLKRSTRKQKAFV